MLVILAPYGRNEVTAAAVWLADLAVTHGRPVRLLSLGAHEVGVHPFWDERALRTGGLRLPHRQDQRRDLIQTVQRAVAGATHVVWFEPLHELLTAARAGAPRAVQLLVPSIGRLRASTVPALRLFDRLICPTGGSCKAIHDLVFDGRPPTERSLTWQGWCPGIPPVRRRGYLEDGRIKALVYCDTASIDECPGSVLYTIEHLLEEIDNLYLTVFSTKSWSRRDRSRWRQLLQRWAPRLTVVRRASLVEQVGLFHAHDWLVCPGTHADLGMVVVRAQACGMPVLCYNISPYSDAVAHGNSGHLVPCEIVINWLGAQRALANAEVFSQHAVRALSSAEALAKMQAVEWHLGLVASFFDAQWSAWLGC